MALSTRLIKRRIRSIRNTRKITKAMELVAASKMRKSVQSALSSRPYVLNLATLVDDVRRLIDERSHPFLGGKPNATSSLVIVAASDRGLCGAFNGQVLKKTFEFLRGRKERSLSIVSVGRRAELAIRRSGYDFIASFEAISNAPTHERIRPIADVVYREFNEGKTDRVFIVYMDYQSAISQVPKVLQLLPIIPEEELVLLHADEANMEDETEKVEKSAGTLECEKDKLLFEPSPAHVLKELLPRYLETRLYHALLESSASEHAARMMAMRNATDNASSMLDDLTLTFNQARQAGITREISEISAGKAALEV